MKWYFKAFALIALIASELPAILADGKITLTEGIDLVKKIAAQLGYDFDDEGITLQKPE